MEFWAFLERAKSSLWNLGLCSNSSLTAYLVGFCVACFLNHELGNGTCVSYVLVAVTET